MRSVSLMWQRLSGSIQGRYSIGLVATAAALLLRNLLDRVLGAYSPYMTLYPTIVFLAMYVGVGPSVASAIVGVLGVTYWFLQHRSFFYLSTPAHIVGSLIFLLVSGAIIAASEVNRRSQARLRHAEEQLRRFLEAAPTGLTRCSRDLRYLSANSAYAEIAGRPLNTIVGRSIIDVMGRDGWETIRPYVERVLRGERVEYETVLPFATAGARQLHVVYTPEKGGEEVVGWVASVTDITEFKRVEKQLQEMEKMAAAGQLAASLAHEINNPLAAVTNLLYLMRQDHSSEYLSAAEEQLARIGDTVKQTLGFYRANPKRVRLNVAGLMDDAVSVFSTKIRARDLHIVRQYGCKREINTFPNELFQIFGNLIGNALDAMNPGGTLFLRTIDCRHGLRVTIADNGCGIPREHLSKIFEPFFSANKEGGTGLGLWLAKQIIQKQGGVIRVRSSTVSYRHGTVFMIWLPLS
jgi:PAS domain S-box-containing protein